MKLHRWMLELKSGVFLGLSPQELETTPGQSLLESRCGRALMYVRHNANKYSNAVLWSSFPSAQIGGTSTTNKASKR
jgi:hypothetical protein